eukprot:9167467-Prorocentrum_lima.AAC.1
MTKITSKSKSNDNKSAQSKQKILAWLLKLQSTTQKTARQFEGSGLLVKNGQPRYSEQGYPVNIDKYAATRKLR